MEIRNAIIITDDNSALRMSLDEQPNFTGNIVFARHNLPPQVARAIDHATGHLPEGDTILSNNVEPQ